LLAIRKEVTIINSPFIPMLVKILNNREKEKEVKLTLKDYIAFVIALLETQLLPVIVIAVIMLILAILLGIVFL